MTLDIKHFILSHLIWVVLVSAAIIGFYAWRGEHDARIQAEATVKAAQGQIQTLQQGIADRDKQAAIQVAPIIKIIHDTVTVPQAVAALPQIVNAPLPAPVVIQPNNAVLIPEPDVLPLFNQVADDKVCRIQLDTTTKDLTDTKAIVVQQTTEIVALKKKPSFWHRVGGTLKTIAIGVGIGVAIAKL
jgi:hypothetical protein